MANTPQNIYLNEISTTTLTTIYTPGTGEVGSNLWLTVANNAATSNQITVYHNDGSTDQILARRTLPAGVGKSWIVSELSGVKANGDDSQLLKIQAGSATAYTVNLSGTVVTS